MITSLDMRLNIVLRNHRIYSSRVQKKSSSKYASITVNLSVNGMNILLSHNYASAVCKECYILTEI